MMGVYLKSIMGLWETVAKVGVLGCVLSSVRVAKSRLTSHPELESQLSKKVSMLALGCKRKQSVVLSDLMISVRIDSINL